MADELNVAAELAALRGDMNTGLARVEGQLNLLVQANGDNRADLDKLETRVSALEARRFPVVPITALSGVVSAAGAAVAIFVR